MALTIGKLNDYPRRIEQDIKALIEKYHAMMGNNLPDLDEDLADAFIMLEVRKVLKSIQDDKLEKLIS
ncbi:hypothetical protein [Cellvibrio sp.]|uniref:hypothetical protein n=1 Tax=Cellvibrio sp. TaxID=1965322 RepID=UPI003964738F